MAKRKIAKWVSYDKDEIQAIIEKMAKEGLSSSQIGLILRDRYGIPDVRQFGIKLNKIAEDARPRQIPDDLRDLLRQAVKLSDHLSKNRSDSKARHSLDKLESKIRSLAKYYIRKNRLPESWSYSVEGARMMVK